MLFVLGEGLSGLLKSRLSGLMAVITIAVSSILIGIFLIITANLSYLVENLRGRVELEVFLDDSFNEEKIETLSTQIRAIHGVQTLTFISKETAVLAYRDLFKEQKDDYFDALGYNPLPASFRVTLKESYRTSTGADSVFNSISSLADINEDDVVYRREFLVLMERYIRIAITIDFLVGSIVCLSALLLVSNNIRLIIISKRRAIETMKLVGATRFLIRMPLYIQGTLQGLIGGLLATVFLYGLLKLSAIEIAGLISVNWQIYILLITLGVLLGVTGSFSAIRRYL